MLKEMELNVTVADFETVNAQLERLRNACLEVKAAAEAATASVNRLIETQSFLNKPKKGKKAK